MIEVNDEDSEEAKTSLHFFFSLSSNIAHPDDISAHLRLFHFCIRAQFADSYIYGLEKKSICEDTVIQLQMHEMARGTTQLVTLD